MLTFLMVVMFLVHGCTSDEAPLSPQDEVKTAAPISDKPKLEAVSFDTATLKIPLVQEAMRRSMHINDKAILNLDAEDAAPAAKSKHASVSSKRGCTIPFKMVWVRGDRSKFERALYLSQGENIQKAPNLVDTLVPKAKPKAPSAVYLSSKLLREEKTRVTDAKQFTLKELSTEFIATSPSEKIGKSDVLYFWNKEHLGFAIDVAMPRRGEVYAMRFEALLSEKEAARLGGSCHGIDQKDILLSK